MSTPPPASAAAASREPAAPAPPTRAAKSGPQQALEKLGLVRDIDLALHVPLRYDDETRVVPIASLRDGATAQVEGVVTDCRVEFRSRRQLVVKIGDGSDDLVLRFLHFYPSHQKTLAVGHRVRVRGEVRAGLLGIEMVHPTFRAVDAGTPLPRTLTPVYPTSAQLPQAYLRKAVAGALPRADLAEHVPGDLLPAGTMPLRAALAVLHAPGPDDDLDAIEDRSHPAWQRLKFDELLAQQIAQLEAKRERERQRAPRFAARVGALRDALLAALPFGLTRAQQRVVAEIDADLAREQPMHRLLQGDVGSGKTVVAALAAGRAIEAGWQCALMAPTEILAEQHLRKLVGWLAPLGVGVAWLTGSRKGKARDRMLEQVASGEAMLVVGTHAVIEEQVRFARLGLAIIDEQHRFGVEQRLALRAKLVAQASSAHGGAALEPHTLMMSATPIPRTLAMTLFADLDVSTIDELPPGRMPIVTKLFADARRDEVIARIRDEIARGRQAYWVCPVIDDETEDGADSTGEGPGAGARAARPGARNAARGTASAAARELENVTRTHRRLSAALPGQPVGLLHGRMPAAEKAATMAAFAAGHVAVLVATTVVEVGVDVANASLMVIEHAERFGLSQLHQLRGRVGRGSVASVCVLLYGSPLSITAKARLKAMLETADGFEISRRDLEIRGPGEFLGARQSGAALLRFADLHADSELVEQARGAAETLLARDPAAAARHVARWLGDRAEYRKA
ncbi:ATP-dependent DNA helicase RecG [Piscinibacter koreensis]|uniref:ATP-dependent DNA helicase RecG n=1 Tax=Piscinibacter koreensis TaxID=2742824 RepID=A0A7Y6NJG4_9BURK|nr:ATP-dependent DNA helicase RecG [Schlegelella koreensis]NUZ04318.1 ATP-dependent DNA helicase RecG [Schlegelella koreensis]